MRYRGAILVLRKSVRGIAALSLVVGCTSTSSRFPEPSFSTPEWFPSLDGPLSVEGIDPTNLLIPGVETPKRIWARHLDLNGDGCEDRILSVESEPAQGPYWSNETVISVVFLGKSPGRFQPTEATRWFSVVTRESQYHVKFGDMEVRRSFRIFRKDTDWMVEIGQSIYGNSGGPAMDRLMTPRDSSTIQLKISDLGREPYRTEIVDQR
jgi:hypothetical protein